ncbi:MAG: hypothetical protein ABIQ88_02290 [Chitinophagaceae bacterium]
MSTYTITVLLVDKSQHVYDNVSEANTEKFKALVWVQGCAVKLDDLTKEIISPFRIQQVFVKKQP